MSSIASITPAHFLPIFTKELWHNIRKNDFGVTVQGGYSAIITVRETILCTIDFLGRINPDKTFQTVWAEEYDFQQDKLMYVYLSTLHNCLSRLTLARLGVPVDENTVDPLVEAILQYCPGDDDEDEPIPDDDADYDAPASKDEDKTGTTPGAEHSGLHFPPEEDELQEPEDCPEITLNICARKPPLCWKQIVAGFTGGAALAALFFRRRR